MISRSLNDTIFTSFPCSRQYLIKLTKCGFFPLISFANTSALTDSTTISNCPLNPSTSSTPSILHANVSRVLFSIRAPTGISNSFSTPFFIFSHGTSVSSKSIYISCGILDLEKNLNISPSNNSPAGISSNFNFPDNASIPTGGEGVTAPAATASAPGGVTPAATAAAPGGVDFPLLFFLRVFLLLVL